MNSNLDNMNSKKGSGSISEDQKRLMIEFLKQNPKLLSGKFNTEFTMKTATSKWEDLTVLLNAIPGAKKDWKNWRKTWHDLRSRTKTKKSKIANHSRATGGGPASEETLSSVDNQIIELICTTSLDGNPAIPESMVEISIEEPRETSNEDAESNIGDTATTIIAGPSNIVNETPCTSRPKRKRGIERLEKSLVATNKLAEQLETKIKIKKEYYDKKLILLERKVLAEERSAVAKEKIADTLQQVVSAIYHTADL